MGSARWLGRTSRWTAPLSPAAPRLELALLAVFLAQEGAVGLRDGEAVGNEYQDLGLISEVEIQTHAMNETAPALSKYAVGSDAEGVSAIAGGRKAAFPSYVSALQFSFWAWSKRARGTMEVGVGYSRFDEYMYLMRGRPAELPWWTNDRWSFWAYENEKPGTVMYTHGFDSHYHSCLVQGQLEKLPPAATMEHWSFWAYAKEPNVSKELTTEHADEELKQLTAGAARIRSKRARAAAYEFEQARKQMRAEADTGEEPPSMDVRPRGIALEDPLADVRPRESTPDPNASLTEYAVGDDVYDLSAVVQGHVDKLPSDARSFQFTFWAWNLQANRTVEISVGYWGPASHTFVRRGPPGQLPAWVSGRWSFWAYDHQEPGTDVYSHGRVDADSYSVVRHGDQESLPEWARTDIFSFWAYPVKMAEARSATASPRQSVGEGPSMETAANRTGEGTSVVPPPKEQPQQPAQVAVGADREPAPGARHGGARAAASMSLAALAVSGAALLGGAFG